MGDAPYVVEKVSLPSLYECKHFFMSELYEFHDDGNADFSPLGNSTST